MTVSHEANISFRVRNDRRVVYKRFRKISNLPLRLVLVVPFVLQVIATVGITGLWSLRNGERTINTLVTQLQTEVSDRIQSHITSFLATPPEINEFAASAFKTGQIQPNQPQQLEQYFLELYRLFKKRGLNHISFGSQTGDYVGVRLNRQGDGFEVLTVNALTQQHLYIYRTDLQGNRLPDLPIDRGAYDPRQRPWYQDAVAAGKPGWSRIYNYFHAAPLGVSHVHPLYDRQHRLTGVLATDLDLADISNFLRSLKISTTGQAFILDTQGRLVASSTPEDLFIVEKSRTERIHASQSQNKLIQGAMGYLQTTFPRLDEISGQQATKIKTSGHAQFLQTIPINGRQNDDWLLVVVIPESDFTSQINANHRTTLLLCLGALIISTGLGVVIYRWICSRTHQLSVVTQAIATGSLDQQIETSGIQEFDTLVQAVSQMGQRLHESSELGHLLGAMCEVIIVYDRQGRCLKIAPTNPDLLIKPPEEQIGKTLYDTLPEPLAAFQLSQIQLVLNTHQSLHNLEYSLFINDQEVWFSASVSPLSADTVLWVARDISDRKRAEAERQSSEEKFATVFRASPNLIVMTTRPDGPLVEVNDSFLKISGYTAEDVLGKTAAELGLWVSLDARAEMLSSLDKQKAFSNREYEFRTRAGEIRTGLLSAEVIEISGVEYALYVVNDITDRKRAEEKLRSQQEVSDRLLRNILPSSIADQLKQHHLLPPEQQEDAFIAEQFDEVTILFADIVGFTTLSSRISPRELVSLLNHIFSAFDELTERYGLEKIKTIGDSYMVVGGLPNPRPDHAAAIANMALDMQIAIAQVSAECHRDLKIRIGINTGSVVAGVIGRKKFAYDLWGDTVNVASRMESSGEAGRIQVTGNTYDRLKDHYILTERAAIVKVKGKGAMTTYWLEGKSKTMIPG